MSSYCIIAKNKLYSGQLGKILFEMKKLTISGQFSANYLGKFGMNPAVSGFLAPLRIP